MIIAGTGHRMEALGGYSEELFIKLVAYVKSVLPSYQPIKVISGMAIGFDQALATAALDLEIPLVAAVPFVGQERVWPEAARKRYREILERAAEVVIVSEGGYSNSKFQVRNIWMIDRCDTVIALFNGSKGGTYNAVKYAESIDKPVCNIWVGWESFKVNESENTN